MVSRRSVVRRLTEKNADSHSFWEVSVPGSIRNETCITSVLSCLIEPVHDTGYEGGEQVPHVDVGDGREHHEGEHDTGEDEK